MLNTYTSSEINESELALNQHSLSVILPAYNEEAVISATLYSVFNTLRQWQMDFEILVVNDGSQDRTKEIVAELATLHPQIHLINHETNQGYGATLVSGFEAATKELTFFMDSDGQFEIGDLEDFLPWIDEFDAVIGYRFERQDSWIRKLNAWGWKWLIGMLLDVHVRDIDCAFKLFHTNFIQAHPLETRGAMINAEIIYRLGHGGYNSCEIGVQHLPRHGGQATGANPRVILRALRELLTYARK